jgi:hypothetical protein
VGDVEGVGRDLGVVGEPRLGQHHQGLVPLGPVEGRHELGGGQAPAVEVDDVDEGPDNREQESIRPISREGEGVGPRPSTRWGGQPNMPNNPSPHGRG